MSEKLWRRVLLSLLIFAGSTVYLSSADAVGKVTTMEGEVEVKPGESETWKALNLGDEVYPKDTIKTAEDSKVEIFFIDESSVSIGPQTTIKIEKLIYSPAKNYRDSSMRLLLGKTRFNVRRLFSRESKFEVRTPTAVAGVKGTRFIVWVLSPVLTRIAVDEGQVSVRNISPLVKGEVLLGRNFGTEIQINTPPSEPKSFGREQMQNMSQGLDIRGRRISTEREGLRDKVEGRVESPPDRMLRGVLLRRPADTSTRDIQTDIIDQPKEEGIPEERREILPHPPSPPGF